jgi:acyl-coenzyme A synthetase/AMP-(fatty) acid ligase
MRETPLIGLYDSNDVLAWDQGGPRTVRRFLADAASLAESLPDRPTALNLATNRYEFLVGFAAAIMRRQVTLLPQSRAPQILLRIAGEFAGSYALTDRGDAIEGIDSVPIQPGGDQTPWPMDNPRIPVDQVVAVAFTSGSTGRPVPNKKTWGALTSVAQATGARLGIRGGDRISVVATVPHQHMFGLEASVMLPIMHGLTMHAGRPLFPADIRSALADAAGRWILVTTPLHLRACVSEGLRMPPGGLILSATAPLAPSLAQQAEKHFQAEVHEIFGFAEAGSIAERRTIDGDRWRPLDGVLVEQEGSACRVQAWYLPAPVPAPDRITVDPEGTFVVHGREEDQVNIAGHRVSLGDLNHTLMQIDGVQDGIFFLPEEGAGLVTRLMAFVVAPGKTSEEIQRMLRGHVDPVFMPRPLVCVPSLPRNATGKLPRESVSELARQVLEKEGDVA